MNSASRLDAAQENAVIAETARFVRNAETLFNRKFDLIPVLFNLQGRAAGVYQVTKNKRQIRYNSLIFHKYYEDNMAVTVPHEVAHYISDVIYGMRNIRPHGKEWQAVMSYFGANASRTCNYDLSGLPVRRLRQYPYICGCSNHQLSSIRHNRVERGTARYFCKMCHGELILAPSGCNDRG